jgi:hypothetical protein
MTRHTWSSKLTALVLCCASAVSGCATAGARGGRAVAAPPSADRAVIADFVRTLPPGTPLKVDRMHGRSVRGTLLKVTPELLIVQGKTRLPEPPIEIPLGDVMRVTPDTGNGNTLAKAIGVGVAVGAGAALAFFMVIAALYAD